MYDAKKCYINRFYKNLACSRKTRLKLLQGLNSELSAYENLSYDEMCSQLGTPEQIASQMMENISSAEIKAFKRIRLLPFLLVSLLFVGIIGILGAYYIHTKQIMRDDFYVVETTTKSEERKISDGFIDDLPNE